MSKTVAHELAKKQREISVAEFFEKNRHLLGFDSKRKALLMTVKEAVDNALDACEEAKILPEISVELIDMGGDRYRIIIEDNGPGIVRKQIPNIFAKLLYGSKFHRLKQARGQQGIGISAAALYGQLTTGKPIKIRSKIGQGRPANYFELNINTQTNQPEIIRDEKVEWKKDQGTRIELDLEGAYFKGNQSVDEYLKETAIVNPHVTIIYTNPKAEQRIFSRVTEELPHEAKEIKPHPYGLELGYLLKMLKLTESRTVQSFLMNDLSRVGAGTAKEICQKAAILTKAKPKDVSAQQAEKLISAIRETKIMSPPTDCISPIGAELVEKGLRKEIKAEFFRSVSRPPAVYRGNPFIIEAAIAYGGELKAEGSAVVLRFANRVPLLYQAGACAITEAISKTNWRSYGLHQSGNSLPQGPVLILVHLASVWAPFTSEAKEAVAHYSEIIKEMKLALQECGRQMGIYVKKKRRVQDEFKKRSYIEKYLPHIWYGLKDLLGLKDAEKATIMKNLENVLEATRQNIEIETQDAVDDSEGEALGLDFGTTETEEPEKNKIQDTQGAEGAQGVQGSEAKGSKEKTQETDKK